MPVISTQSQAIPAYPDFDADFLKQSASVTAAETDLLAYISKNKIFFTDTIKCLIASAQNEHKSFANLAGRTNAHYKMVKRELTIRTENEAKAKDEKKHAVEKVKQYKAKLNFLEQKFLTDCSSKADLDIWYAQERKRKRPPVDNEVEEMRPRKVVAAGEKTTHAVRVIPATPKQQSQNTSSYSPASSSAKSSSTSPTPPIPRSTKTDFTKEIPSMVKHNFASTRLERPNSLSAPVSSSPITAVLQGLCATMETHEAWKDLADGDKLSGNFIDYIANMQRPSKHDLDIRPILNLFPKTQDPLLYFYQVMSKIKSPYIENAYQVRCDYNIAHSSTAKTKLSHETHWTLDLSPHFSEAESRYKGVPSRNLMQLLREKVQYPQFTNTNAEAADLDEKSHVRKAFLGLAYAPENIVFSFEPKQRCKIFLPVEQDFAEVVRASGLNTRYRLVTVVKKMKSGMFAAYVHADDGKWFRAVDHGVKEVGVDDLQGEKGGDPVMAFYEQLG
jgi:hypothetical protein